MKTSVAGKDGKIELLSETKTNVSGGAKLLVDLAGTEVQVSDDAGLAFGRQKFAYSTASRVYILN